MHYRLQYCRTLHFLLFKNQQVDQLDSRVPTPDSRPVRIIPIQSSVWCAPLTRAEPIHLLHSHQPTVWFNTAELGVLQKHAVE